MTRNLREEVDIAPYVERGVIDVHDPAVRDNINTLLTGALGQCFITPYIALEKVRKVLAYYHIFLPKTTFLEGDRGVEVFDIKQFGELAGMRNNGDVVTRVDGSQNLYFEYKMNDKGMYDIFCEIVTNEELDDLVDNVEDEINDEDVEDNREEKLDENLGSAMKFFKKIYTIGNDSASGDPRKLKERLKKSDTKFIQKIANQPGKLSGAAELQRRLARRMTNKEKLDESEQLDELTAPNKLSNRQRTKLANKVRVKMDKMKPGSEEHSRSNKILMRSEPLYSKTPKMRKESSESVDMAGPETGPKPYPGGPEIGMAIVAAIMKKKKLEEEDKKKVY